MPIDMWEAKFSVMPRLRRAGPRRRYVRNTYCAFPNVTATFQEDDNLFIHELFPHFRPNLVYDLVRSVAKGGLR